MPDKDWEHSPVGLALLDQAGCVTRLNSSGRAILGNHGGALQPLHALLSGESGLVEGQPASGTGWSTAWIKAAGNSVELAYRMQRVGEAYSVAFYDVTRRRQRERRAMAVARTAARVASERSLPATLSALAHEILQADGLAGVQVLTNEYSGDKLHMLGMAGFPASRSGAFFSLLMECRRRGADLGMLNAMESGKPVIFPHRYDAFMSNPAWEPLHEFHRYPTWDAFASIPIKVRQNTIGILNAFLAPGQALDEEAIEFLTSMAEQAGLAIDYASMLEEERSAAHREERQRLARDLHDSAVQQVFSMGMLTQTLKILTDGPERDQRIHAIAAELEDITGSVLKDLRGLVTQLRPTVIGSSGLRGALTRLTATTHRQTGVKFELNAEAVVDEIGGELAEDLYYVAAEAVHNAVKHSPADLIVITLDVSNGQIRLTVRDNGGKPEPPGAAREALEHEGHGLAFMRQRVERWNGAFDVDLNFGGAGTVVRAEVPHLVTYHSPGRQP
ncbi:GAF domain-containing sensor histidine kinase [Arthrobacter sp. CAU 1506]|uniref:GAF domain-containing sensor histidine kinase n=1 Tax=Arthrobacter sp. CAU 1506 TaxID=2560052 RepID=UPI0026A4A789